MTTDEATEKLARIWVLGGFGEAETLVAACIAHSRAWNWSAANRAMNRAYAVLGVEAPAVAVNAIHKGMHPVQVAADAFMTRKHAAKA